MSSVGSINASVESPRENPLLLPQCHVLSPTPISLSPHTIQTTLQTQPELNAVLLRGIANGLLQTITNWEADTAVAAKHYEDRICTLEQRVFHYEDTFNEPPIGYILNNGKVSNFHILVGDGLYQEVKWIHLNDNGTVSGYHSTQGPNEQPHIINLYTAPNYSIDLPLEALPPWFQHMLTSPGGNFQILQQAMADTNDWGLAQEIAHYCKLDDNVAAVAIKIEQYQQDLDAIQAHLASCESHLMLSQAADRVPTLQNIPCKLGTVCSGWRRGSRGTCSVHIHMPQMDKE
jgi:hypothetical protein